MDKHRRAAADRIVKYLAAPVRRPLLLDNEPWPTIHEHLGKLAERLYIKTGRQGITRLVLTKDVGLACGVLPGQEMQLACSTGYITISVDGPRVEPIVDHDAGDEDRSGL